MRLFVRLLNVVVPLLIVGALLLAGFFYTPVPEVADVDRPLLEHRDRLYGIERQSSGRIWIVGSSGKIVYSDDEGETWNYVNSGFSHSIQDIAAWNERRLVAVGNGGRVVISQDGGETWSLVETPKSAIANKLFRVKVAGKGEGWAVGESGMILRTRDYGESWARVGEEEDIAWNDIFVLGEQVWIVGEFGGLAASSDRGETWEDFELPVEASLMSVAFRDPDNGVIVGLGGTLLVTADAGKTWESENYSLDSPANQSSTDQDASAEQDLADSHLFNVIWSGERWIVTGEDGVVVVGNLDGTRWNLARTAEADRNWYVATISGSEDIFLAGSTYKKVPKNQIFAGFDGLESGVVN